MQTFQDDNNTVSDSVNMVLSNDIWWSNIGISILRRVFICLQQWLSTDERSRTTKGSFPFGQYHTHRKPFVSSLYLQFTGANNLQSHRGNLQRIRYVGAEKLVWKHVKTLYQKKKNGPQRFMNKDGNLVVILSELMAWVAVQVLMMLPSLP